MDFISACLMLFGSLLGAIMGVEIFAFFLGAMLMGVVVSICYAAIRVSKG